MATSTAYQLPRNAKRPVIDCFIGLDFEICAIQEVRERPGEPIARLTPLGWTCIGNPMSAGKATLQTNFAGTYFVNDRAGIDEMNADLKRFWEIEDMTVMQTGIMGEKHMRRLEEQKTLKKNRFSMKTVCIESVYPGKATNQRCQVITEWLCGG